MLNIAICDDIPDLVDKLEALLIQYQKEHNEAFYIKKFLNGIRLVEDKEEFDLIFLDIKMPSMNGIEAAKQIRSKNKAVDIIFLTSLIQYAIDGYKVNAFNYIIKPINYKRLKNELDKWIVKKQHETNAYIAVKNDNGYYKILLNSIHYIETYNRNLLIHTDNDSIICYRKMKEVEQELILKGFARCHSSYIVNLQHIASIEKMEICLITNECIPISKNKRKDFLESMANYWGKCL